MQSVSVNVEMTFKKSLQGDSLYWLLQYYWFKMSCEDCSIFLLTTNLSPCMISDTKPVLSSLKTLHHIQLHTRGWQMRPLYCPCVLYIAPEILFLILPQTQINYLMSNTIGLLNSVFCLFACAGKEGFIIHYCANHQKGYINLTLVTINKFLSVLHPVPLGVNMA